jgi:hypothetical protein
VQKRNFPIAKKITDKILHNISTDKNQCGCLKIFEQHLQEISPSPLDGKTK